MIKKIKDINGENNIKNHYNQICDIVEGDVSAEVIATDYQGMLNEGTELVSLHPQIVVKVPYTKEGIKAIKHFNSVGIRTNCTLIFSAEQALLTAKIGATNAMRHAELRLPCQKIGVCID